MTLKELRIELITYGPLKGGYDVTIRVTEGSNEIKLALPPELGEAMVNQAKDLIHKFSVRAADRLHQELLLATPESQKQIEG
jgi:hypothetical protein